MEHIRNAIVYIIPSIIICSIYNLILENNIFNKNVTPVSWMYRLKILIMVVYLSLLFKSSISPVYGFSTSINWNNNININPFRIFIFIKEKPLSFLKDIIIFIPFGILIPSLCSKFKSIYRCLFAGITLSLSIELFQIFLYKGTDIDNVIIGAVGTFIGYVIYVFLKSINYYIKEDSINLYDNNDKTLSILIILIFITVISTGFFIRYKNLNIEASNACLIDVDTKDILFSKNSDEKIAPASTTKMITAITVLDFCDIDEEVIVGDEVSYVHKDASKAGLEKGNMLTIKQLLDGLLLPSGNDAAYVLAKYTGEKISNKKVSTNEAIAIFMKAINEKAICIGATNSKFIRPDGYDTKGQYTTAKDLACIAESFMKSDTLSDIVSNYKVSDVLLDGSRVTYENTNELINPYSEYYYTKIKGLKTGSSLNAGKCVVSAADIDDKTYICVVMGSTDEGRWLDSLALYQYVK